MNIQVFKKIGNFMRQTDIGVWVGWGWGSIPPYYYHDCLVLWN